MSVIPASLAADLAIAHPAAFGEICLAVALDELRPDEQGAVPRRRMEVVGTPSLLVCEIEGMTGVRTLRAEDGSFTITFGREAPDLPLQAWIVVSGIALHTAEAGRLPFRAVLCRIIRTSMPPHRRWRWRT